MADAHASRKILGSRAEALVTDLLKERGYRIIGRNIRVRYGEIDIVAAKRDLVWMVEVRSRRVPAGHDSCYPIATHAKVHRMYLSGASYMRNNGWDLERMRIVLALVRWNDTGLKEVDMIQIV
jgi:putative endonuclease